MSNRLRAFAALLPLLLFASAPPGPAGAAVRTTKAGGTSQARIGFGRSYRAPSYRARSRARPSYGRRYRRPGFGHVFGGILRTLGIAYLFHALFGWGGGGGSPFGLLLLAAIVLFAVTRRRRRAAYY